MTLLYRINLRQISGIRKGEIDEIENERERERERRKEIVRKREKE